MTPSKKAIKKYADNISNALMKKPSSYQKLKKKYSELHSKEGSTTMKVSKSDMADGALHTYDRYGNLTAVRLKRLLVVVFKDGTIGVAVAKMQPTMFSYIKTGYLVQTCCIKGKTSRGIVPTYEHSSDKFEIIGYL